MLEQFFIMQLLCPDCMNMEDVVASLQHSIKDFFNHLEDELGKVRYSSGDIHEDAF